MKEYDDLAETAKLELIPFDAHCSTRIHNLIATFLQMAAPIRCDVVDAILSVANEREAKTIVVEREYVDEDYLETYSRHYSKVFKPKSPYCMRLHFFGKDVTLNGLFDLPDEIKQAYLGYCILRPTGQQYVSRTIISPPRDPDHATQFIPAAGRFRAHLVGHRVSVSGAPFIQQDANTFICAGAAIWSVARFMHAVHKTPRYYPAEITALARESFSHGQIRKGLTVEQIVMTLQRMGLNPHVELRSGLCELRESNSGAHRAELARLVDLIHVFVDSAFPPILAYMTPDGGGHAVSVVGHDIIKRKLDQDKVKVLYGEVLSNSYFVDRFYVMDDARGPYAAFSIEDSDDDTIPSLSRCGSLAIIAPMPTEVTLEYDDARQELWKFLKKGWNELLGKFPLAKHGLKKDDYAIESLSTNPIVLRTALLDSRVWKRQVLKGGYPGWLRMRYQALLLPKFVWVVEIGDYLTTNHGQRSDRRILGEVILDATANPHWPLDSWLSFHVKGLYVDVDDHIAHAPDGFEPYPPLRRTDES